MISLTPLSFGGAPIANLFTAMRDEDARGAVDAAWARGIRYFDTAPHYGLGLSERRLGEALRARPRDEYVLSTKIGRVLEPVRRRRLRRGGRLRRQGDGDRRRWDFSRDGVLRSLDDSLERLGLDRVDIVFIHDCDDHREQAFDEAIPALVELRAQGVVRAIGAGMNQSAMLTDFVRETDVDVHLLAGRYTLLEQTALDDLLPACEERGVRIVAGGVFNSGLLALPEPPDDATYNYRRAPRGAARARPRARRASAAATACRCPPRRWPSRAATRRWRPSGRRAHRRRGRAQRRPVRADIPEDLWAELKAEGLLRADAP